MNILFISSLSSNIAAGMSWSVPASVEAQSKVDNVLWVNVSDAYIEHWSKVRSYHNYKEFGEEAHLQLLPKPFNKPDCIVFEGLYDVVSPKLAKEARLLKIPYIIIPRSALTKQAQNNHAKWKKRIANLLIFNRYIRKAASIQYLTEAEMRDSGNSWNKNHFILPNGFTTPEKQKTTCRKDAIKAIFIGRLDMYQKGLDVLIESCDLLKDELRAAGFSLCIYGPERYQYAEIKKFIEDHHLGDFMSMGGETSGVNKENNLLDSDLFILTSRFEGHPMGLIEALAYGVPAIVTPGSNMAKEIRDANAGWTCEDVTVEDVTKMLRRVIAERNQIKEKSKNAIELARPYDWSKLAERFHIEIKKIIQSE